MKKYISLIFIFALIFSCIVQPSHARTIRGDLDVTGEFTADTITVQTVDGETVTFKTMNFDTAFINNLVGETLNTDTHVVNNPVQVILKNKSNDTTVSITDEGKLRTTSSIEMDTVHIQRIIDSNGNRIDFDNQNRLRVFMSGRAQGLGSLSDTEEQFFQNNYDTIVSNLITISDSISANQPRTFTNFDTSVRVVSRDWSLNNNEDSVSAEISNLDTDVRVTARDWFLSKDKDTVVAIIADTGVRIEQDQAGLAKSSDIQNLQSDVNDTLPRKTERLWDLDSSKDSITIPNHVDVNIYDNEGNKITSTDSAMDVYLTDTSIHVASRGWGLNPKSDTVNTKRSWKLTKGSDTVNIADFEQDTDVDVVNQVQRAWNLNKNSDTVNVADLNQDTDVDVVNQVKRAWNLSGQSDSVNINNMDTRTLITGPDGTVVEVDTNALKTFEVAPQRSIFDDVTGMPAYVRENALMINLLDTEANKLQGRTWRLNRQSDTVNIADFDQDTSVKIVAPDGTPIGNDSDALKIFEVSPQRSLIDDETGEFAKIRNHSLWVQLSDTQINKLTGRDWLLSGESDSVTVSNPVQREWNLDANQDTVGVTGDIKTDTNFVVVDENGNAVSVEGSSLNVKETDPRRILHDSNGNTVDVENNALLVKTVNQNNDTDVDIVSSIPLDRNWNLSSGQDTVSVDGLTSIKGEVELIDSNDNPFGVSGNPLVMNQTNTGVDIINQVKRAWSLNAQEDTVNVTGNVSSQTDTDVNIVGSDGTVIENDGNALKTFEVAPQRSIIDDVTGEYVKVDSHSLRVILSDTQFENLRDRAWSLNAQEDTVNIEGTVDANVESQDTRVQIIGSDGTPIANDSDALQVFEVAPQRSIIDDSTGVNARVINGGLRVNYTDTVIDLITNRNWSLDSSTDSINVEGNVTSDTDVLLRALMSNGNETNIIATQNGYMNVSSIQEGTWTTARSWNLNVQEDTVNVKGTISEIKSQVETDTNVNIVGSDGTVIENNNDALKIFETDPNRSIVDQVTDEYAKVINHGLQVSLTDTSIEGNKERNWSLDSNTDSVEVKGQVQTDTNVEIVSPSGNAIGNDSDALRVIEIDPKRSLIGGSTGEYVGVDSHALNVAFRDTQAVRAIQEGVWNVVQAGAWSVSVDNQDTDVRVTNKLPVDTDALIIGKTNSGTHVKVRVDSSGRIVSRIKQFDTWNVKSSRNWNLEEGKDTVTAKIEADSINVNTTKSDEITAYQSDGDSYDVNIVKQSKEEFYDTAPVLDSGDTIAINFGDISTEYSVTPVGGNIYWSTSDTTPSVTNDIIIDSSKYIEDSVFTDEIYIKATKDSTRIHVRALK